jgi:hypothetical protein
MKKLIKERFREDLNPVFLQGFDALNYEEHLDYELVQSTNPEFNKVPLPCPVLPSRRLKLFF